MECSTRMADISESRVCMGPKDRTKCPFGYCEETGLERR